MRITSPWATCEKCFVDLDYMIGSIRQQCNERDLCQSCELDESGKEIAQMVRDIFAEPVEPLASAPQLKKE
jgi:hypothetical protein